MILILVDVSGIRKTTVGKLRSTRTGRKFEDGDDYHSEENRQKMAVRGPLSDADRAPWLTVLHERMAQYFQQDRSAIFDCSALKRQYCERPAKGFAENELRFVYLVCARRCGKRADLLARSYLHES